MINTFAIRATLRRNSYVMQGILSKGTKGAIIGALSKGCGGDEQRHIVLSWLFDYEEPPLVPKSSHKLTEGQWCALNHWIDFRDRFVPSDKFLTEIRFVTKAAISAAGAQEEEYQNVPQSDTTTRAAICLGGRVKRSKSNNVHK